MDIVDDLRVHLGYLSRTVLLQVRDHDVRRDHDGIHAETEGRCREDDGSAAPSTPSADRSPAAGRGRRVP
ncbi:hypothetical protein [Mycoplana sp. MJR14]|uniref:hypothetical protein n=1 Tax=Mycoplana sp. MJR14 TaxID=3032583 RepID=UPI0023DC8188|nr:hypothetical protein [Mycoplana sp. MJR14]MDF1632443.1 hypothetical protein [Mycoplana sp. MJR14]